MARNHVLELIVERASVFWFAKVIASQADKNMTASTPNPYGIPIVKRAAKRAPTQVAPAVGGASSSTMASAKKVIAEHREVIRALAKR